MHTLRCGCRHISRDELSAARGQVGDKGGTRGDEDTKLCYRKFVIEVPENLCTF